MKSLTESSTKCGIKTRPKEERPTSPPPGQYKGYGDLSRLDFSKGGIPKTGWPNGNKNREALLIVDRKKDMPVNIMADVAKFLFALLRDEIDTIVIDIKERTWE